MPQESAGDAGCDGAGVHSLLGEPSPGQPSPPPRAVPRGSELEHTRDPHSAPARAQLPAGSESRSPRRGRISRQPAESQTPPADREQTHLCGSRGWRLGGRGGVRVALALGIVHPSLARPRPPLSPLGLDPASLGPVAVLPAPSPGRLAMLPPKRSDLRPDPASGRPADAHGRLCLSPPWPGRGRGARRAAGRCSEGRRVCGPATRQPPAALRGTRTPSRAPQMLIPRPTGRALEHNDVAVNITTQADGLEAEGVSQSAERKGREWAGTGQRGAARGRRGAVGVHRTSRETGTGKRGGSQGSGARRGSPHPQPPLCVLWFQLPLAIAARKNETEASGNKRFALSCAPF